MSSLSRVSDECRNVCKVDGFCECSPFCVFGLWWCGVIVGLSPNEGDIFVEVST